ncbi:MAG: hypothetical protein ACK4ND_13140 [Cytophagaceae bacterium]
MKVNIETSFNIGFPTAIKYVQYPSLLEYIVWPLMQFEPLEPISFPSVWTEGMFLVKMKLLGIVSLGTQYIQIELPPSESSGTFVIRDNGSGQLIKVWDHIITIKKTGESTVSYRDEVTIKAGILTPFIWAFAYIFYKWRQFRWKKLVKGSFCQL